MAFSGFLNKSIRTVSRIGWDKILLLSSTQIVNTASIATLVIPILSSTLDIISVTLPPKMILFYVAGFCCVIAKAITAILVPQVVKQHSSALEYTEKRIKQDEAVLEIWSKDKEKKEGRNYEERAHHHSDFWATENRGNLKTRCFILLLYAVALLLLAIYYVILQPWDVLKPIVLN
ncbi:hypothetical protein KW479_22280 [Vibrio fluvialis]|uniref:hypothetical protein n=1 Tax=Vibrio parahaemolyticus TaxID=670 RepID=UPI001C9D0356|nr:hypothetical protein [Vibrio fluvialis]